MINFKSDFQRTATAILGTFVLTTTFVGAAIGPARAVETAPVTYAAAAQNTGHVNA
ncbi:hypothetical protein [Allosphingosinicella vermicomposti]|uniref:hypothetical protein n=1 Tax=Allosphingosinicella vermicomposti TaxID=614671 RepID=UPI00131A5A1C|nr:hypothetical protein [Allosphingosinicella vermicomposti]